MGLGSKSFEMSRDLLRDPQYLLDKQYYNAANLNARKGLHARFSTNPYDWFLWVFDRLHVPAEAQLLEIGCGPGDLWQKNSARIPAGWQVTLTDFSMGMVQAASGAIGKNQQFAFVQANAQALPFLQGRFDAVIANHMLYHVPDMDRALREIRRVLKPGGRLLAATNGEDHLRELRELLVRFSPQAVLPSSQISFRAENGAMELKKVFLQVAWESYPDALEVTEAESLAAYVFSMTRNAYLEDFPDQRSKLVDFLENELQRTGSIHITKRTGLFTAIKYV